MLHSINKSIFFKFLFIINFKTSQASNEIERNREERIKKEVQESKRLASSFRARPIPLSTIVASASVIRHNKTVLESRDHAESPLFGLDLLSDEGSTRSSIEVLDESANKNNNQNLSPISLLNSSVRARSRKLFEKRKSTLLKEKQSEKENQRSQLATRLSMECELLRESIR